uniref:Uncharacterized protein n=1 Tax=Tanacetum cinerariifolium TaxID=118510 RepID=A0A6L2L083_TANCI|nr:hypothetical protein [Tanacetum cinerariifolium]
MNPKQQEASLGHFPNEAVQTNTTLLEEFSDELTHIDFISLEIDEADLDPQEEVHLVKKLLYDNSSPRPSKELDFENYYAVIKYFSSSPIPVEGDVLFLEELLNDDSISLLENESFHFNHYYDPSYPHPPAKPLDDDGIHFDAEPDTGILTVKVVDDISEHKVFNLGILASKEEKSLHILSHWGFKAFHIIFDFFESSMIIYEGNIPILDVPFLYLYPP